MGINWYAIPLARITIAFALGIGFGYAIELQLPFKALIFVSLCFAGAIYWKKYPNVRYTLSWIGWLLTGWWALSWNTSLQANDYFSKELNGEEVRVIGTAEEVVPAENHTRVLLKVHTFLKEDSIASSSGKWMIWLEHASNSTNDTIQINEQLLVRAVPERPRPAMNPGDFNYRYYLWTRDIHRSAFVPHENWHIINSSAKNDLFCYSRTVKEQLMNRFNKHLSNTSAAFANALILGHKDHLSNEVRQSFQKAGASHVMAVSGLHVGIIYSMIFLLLKGIRRVVLLSEWSNTIILLLSVWGFAFICGLPASVCRASLMFSIWRLSKHSYASNQSFNAYFAAAFLLLWIEPKYLFQVGFQFSFLAVGGILLLFPYLRSLWIPAFRPLEYAWQIILVSASAQIFLLPLTAYYFGYTTVLSLLSSLIVIPAAYLILGLGIFVLLASFILPDLIQLLSQTLEILIQLTISGVDLLNGCSFAQWNTDSVSLLITVGSMCSIGLLAGMILTRNKFYLKGGLMFIMILGLCSIPIHFQSRNGHLFIPHQDQLKIQWVQSGIQKEIYGCSSEDLEKDRADQSISIEIHSHDTSYTLTIVRSHLPVLPTDIWIADGPPPSASPGIHRPHTLILPKNLSYRDRYAWRDFAEKHDMNCHDISREGAFIQHNTVKL